MVLPTQSGKPVQPSEARPPSPARHDASTPPRSPGTDFSSVVTELIPQNTTPAQVEHAPGLVDSRVRRFGRYDLLEMLKPGGMGIVWKAHDSRLDRIVALKRIKSGELARAEEVERFKREAMAAAQFEQQNIVRIYEVGECDGEHYFTMEFVWGGSLTDYGSRLAGDARAAVALMEKIARAVQYLHDKNIIHRDLKPGNILVDEHGEPKVSDFGLAKQMDSNVELTPAGAPIGTYAYMSPEQITGKSADIGRQSDIWALGVMLYEMLTGQRPFPGNRLEDLIQQIPSAEPTALPRIKSTFDSSLNAIVSKCLEKEPAARYPSSQALADDLGRWLRGESTVARPIGWHVRAWRIARRRRSQLAAAFVFFSLLAALVVIALNGKLGSQGTPGNPFFTRTVLIATNPAGASVVLVPVDEYGYFHPEARIRPTGVTPVTVADVPPANYLVIATLEGHGFHEVYRLVPDARQGIGTRPHNRWQAGANGTLELPPIRIPEKAASEAGMARFAGKEFTMGVDRLRGDPHTTGVFSPAHQREVASFFLETTEVTVGAYERIKERKPLGLRAKPPAPDLARQAVTHVTFDDALEYAELAGRRLPTEIEYEFAATMGGSRSFPWGEDAERLKEIVWLAGPVGEPEFDCLPTEPKVYGLYSNVLEWTDSMGISYSYRDNPTRLRVIDGGEEYFRMIRDLRVVRGGPESLLIDKPLQAGEMTYGTRRRPLGSMDKSWPVVGFRCARSASPRFVEAEPEKK